MKKRLGKKPQKYLKTHKSGKVSVTHKKLVKLISQIGSIFCNKWLKDAGIFFPREKKRNCLIVETYCVLSHLAEKNLHIL